MLLWFFGGIVGTCGLLVWLELGLSLPIRVVQVMPGIFERTSVPRSGGEKNYVRGVDCLSTREELLMFSSSSSSIQTQPLDDPNFS